MTAALRVIVAGLLLLPAVAQGGPAYEPESGDPARALKTRELQYLAETAEPLRFLSAARARLPAGGAERPQLNLLLGRQLTRFGLREAAGAIYRRQLDYRLDVTRRNGAWFELANAWFRHHRLQQAEAALEQVHGPLPEDAQGSKPVLKARVLIARGRFEAAADTLRDADGPLNAYARYNLGVALIRAGRTAEGAGELNAVGRLNTETVEGRALRDQANLALGYSYLEAGQGATARALFQRIRLEGAASDKALLGLGWAELAPDGDPQEHTLLKEIACREDPARLLPDTLPVLRRMPREACGPPKMFRDTDRFRTEEGGATTEERAQRALVPWLELLHRDPASLAVHEAWTAVPHAYGRLGSRDQAIEYYGRAIDILERQRDQVGRVTQRLADSDTRDVALPPGSEPDLAWFSRRWNLPADAAMPYLATAMSQATFRSTATQIQDLIALEDWLLTRDAGLRELQATLRGRRTALARADIAAPAPLQAQERRLRALQDRLNGLRQRIAELVAAHGDRLRDLALDATRARARYLDTYLTNSRLGQASLLQGTDGRAAPVRKATP